jgi:hypothetical protein
MIIVGVYYHSSDQYIASADTERESAANGGCKPQGGRNRKVLPATGGGRLLAELGIAAWISDAAEIKTKRVHKQMTDPEGASALHVKLRTPVQPYVVLPHRHIEHSRAVFCGHSGD